LDGVTRLFIRSYCDAPNPGEIHISAPWLRALPVGNPDLLSLLPVVDLNAAALRSLDPPAGRVDRGGVFAALALVDPFLRPRDAVARLRRAGISGVANFPTMQVVDGETARAFEGAGARTTREVEMLEAFIAESFRTIAFACGPDAAREVARTRPTMMVLHPGVALSDWRQRAAGALSVQRLIDSCRTLAACPVLIYRPAGFGSELDQAVAAADGEVRIED
jgi:predicted TIM-barrel enzyme